MKDQSHNYSDGGSQPSSFLTLSQLLPTFSIATAISSFDLPSFFAQWRATTSSDKSILLRSGFGGWMICAIYSLFFRFRSPKPHFADGLGFIARRSSLMKLTLRVCNSIHLLLQLPHLPGTVFETFASADRNQCKACLGAWSLNILSEDSLELLSSI